MMPNGPVVLVNGATGRLGRAILSLESPIERRPSVRLANAALPNAIITAEDCQLQPDALSSITAIINCAGVVSGDRAAIRRANVDHAVSLAKCAKAAGVRRFVQVSSFSVFGRANLIGVQTPVRPENEYGRSKLEADRELASLTDNQFTVLSVRIPFMFDAQSPTLMSQLVTLLRKIPLFPVTRSPTIRSMMTYSDAADRLLAAAVGSDSGEQCIADPKLFTFELLTSLMIRNGESVPQFVRLPSLAARFAATFVPSIGRRLFESNVLDPNFNMAANVTMHRGIDAEILELLRK